VKDQRLGKQLKARPVAKKAISGKLASSPRRPRSTHPTVGSSVHRPQSPRRMHHSPYSRPYYEDDRPTKRARSGKVSMLNTFILVSTNWLHRNRMTL
jgi:hypothetical protein